MIVYVNDIILTGEDREAIHKIEMKLAVEFEMKDLGNVRFFFGMEVSRNQIGVSISQRKYNLDLLKETGMLGYKHVETPMDPSMKLQTVKDDTLVDKGRYQRLVGWLIYLQYTRPDITFSVNCVSQFMHSPTENHMTVIYRILKYLKGTPGRGLLFE